MKMIERLKGLDERYFRWCAQMKKARYNAKVMKQVRFEEACARLRERRAHLNA